MSREYQISHDGHTWTFVSGEVFAAKEYPYSRWRDAPADWTIAEEPHAKGRHTMTFAEVLPHLAAGRVATRLSFFGYQYRWKNVVGLEYMDPADGKWDKSDAGVSELLASDWTLVEEPCHAKSPDGLPCTLHRDHPSADNSPRMCHENARPGTTTRWYEEPTPLHGHEDCLSTKCKHGQPSDCTPVLQNTVATLRDESNDLRATIADLRKKIAIREAGETAARRDWARDFVEAGKRESDLRATIARLTRELETERMTREKLGASNLRLNRELAETRQAKAENDERFMTERDQARRELAEAKRGEDPILGTWGSNDGKNWIKVTDGRTAHFRYLRNVWRSDG